MPHEGIGEGAASITRRGGAVFLAGVAIPIPEEHPFAQDPLAEDPFLKYPLTDDPLTADPFMGGLLLGAAKTWDEDNASAEASSPA